MSKIKNGRLDQYGAGPFEQHQTERQSAQMSKIKNGRLDQYGAGPFEQHQFATAGVGGVNEYNYLFLCLLKN